MAQGRGSAVAVAVVLVCMLVSCVVAESEVYTVVAVGGKWVPEFTPNKVRAGDAIQFQFDASIHNVVTPGTWEEYNNCVVLPYTPIFPASNATFEIHSGPNFFFCSRHCRDGMGLVFNISSKGAFDQ